MIYAVSDIHGCYEQYKEILDKTGFSSADTLYVLGDVLDEQGRRLDQGLAVCFPGPGSFTGLRIGLAVVKGLALPRQIPCAGVSTMAALAYGLAGEGTVIGAQDARRGQVYWGAFDLAAHDRLTPDTAAPVTTLENFVQTCKKPLFFVGDGATLCYNTYKNVPGVVCVPQPMQVLRGAGVALAARAMWERGECVPPAALLPDYHRLSQAERERAEREKTEGKQNEV